MNASAAGNAAISPGWASSACWTTPSRRKLCAEGKFSKGEVDLDVAKLAVIGEGKAPELLDFFGVELPDGVRDNLDIKVSVRAEVALSAEDVARLARMSKHGREMAKHLYALGGPRAAAPDPAREAAARHRALAAMNACRGCFTQAPSNIATPKRPHEHRRERRQSAPASAFG